MSSAWTASLVLAVATTGLLYGCDSSPSPEPEIIDRVDIISFEPRLYGAGHVLQVQAYVRYESGASEPLVGGLWKSSDPSILTVAQNGTITAVAPGSALVSAEVDGVVGVRRFEVVPAYLLPFDVGTSRNVIQAFGGSFTHTGTWTYSYDFVMPIGTTIRAARAGTVHAVEESHVDGDNTLGHENYLIIDHGDGTYARYLHLTQNGALVEREQSVAAGAVIAMSGNTGYSTLPHLHFDVAFGCALPLPNCSTIEYWFVNSSPRQPQQGDRVTAEPPD